MCECGRVGGSAEGAVNLGGGGGWACVEARALILHKACKVEIFIADIGLICVIFSENFLMFSCKISYMFYE